MDATRRRETIEDWVADFLASPLAAGHEPAAREGAPALLVAFLEACCAVRDVAPAEIEASDLAPALLDDLAARDVPEGMREPLPALAGDLLAFLETEGRLSEGRSLGLRVRALKERWLDAAAGRVRPIVSAAPKIGRNDPCPCGSGRKYKRCCMD